MSNEEELPSNWGRWGDEDEKGTLNLITDEVRARAAAEVRTGHWASLARPIEPAAIMSGPFVPSSIKESPVQQLVVHPVNPGDTTCAHVDVLFVTNHHPRSTHLDSISHISNNGMVYPGRPAAEAITPAGVKFGSSTGFSAGIVTRGVLLDLAVDGPLPEGYAVTGEDLEGAEKRQGVHVESGDALVVRMDWEFGPNPEVSQPGISVDAVRWMHRRGVSLYAGDVGDAFPALDPAHPSPLHSIGIGRMGMPLVDAPNVEELVVLCRELDRYSFMLTAAPPRVSNATGLPVNPLALF
ncbi:cyclase family protein [Streptomyces sp. SID12488]|uniref:cyclase family protein n=1 Tax=Streptomyces sp. SID12488 TaxID=2706040 RepID=UPI0013D9380E|nr:cyclase family protein [Streptomyces sp. SID12488]NEA64503.1 cyclase family protein [Streptomyces sp. SID12488]